MARLGGEGGIRTHGGSSPHRFSRAAPSTTRTPLQLIKYTNAVSPNGARTAMRTAKPPGVYRAASQRYAWQDSNLRPLGPQPNAPVSAGSDAISPSARPEVSGFGPACPTCPTLDLAASQTKPHAVIIAALRSDAQNRAVRSRRVSPCLLPTSPALGSRSRPGSLGDLRVGRADFARRSHPLFAPSADSGYSPVPSFPRSRACLSRCAR
jgi:hypothetical protein